MAFLGFNLICPAAQSDHRFDYLLISHFLLNLQDVSTVPSGSPCITEPDLSFVLPSQDTARSSRFADAIIGNLGESLRGPSGDEDPLESMEDGEMPVVTQLVCNEVTTETTTVSKM